MPHEIQDLITMYMGKTVVLKHEMVIYYFNYITNSDKRFEYTVEQQEIERKMLSDLENLRQ